MGQEYEMGILRMGWEHGMRIWAGLILCYVEVIHIVSSLFSSL